MHWHTLKITTPPLYELADCSRLSRAVRRTLFSRTHGSVVHRRRRRRLLHLSIHNFNVLITRLFVCENWQIREQHEALDAFIPFMYFLFGTHTQIPPRFCVRSFHSLSHTYHNIHSYLGFHGSSSCKKNRQREKNKPN